MRRGGDRPAMWRDAVGLRPSGALAATMEDNRGDAGASTVGGGTAAAPDTLVSGQQEVAHVVGAVAGSPVQPARALMSETVPLTGASALPLTMAVPDGAGMSSDAGSASIQLLTDRENAAVIADLDAASGIASSLPGLPGAGSPPAGIGAAVAAAAPVTPLDARHLTWTERASVEAAVLTVGDTTVVLSNVTEVVGAASD